MYYLKKLEKLNNMFGFNPLYLSDGYKPGHKAMLAPGTTRLYGSWIPRKIKYMPEGIDKIVSIGQSFTWKWLNKAFEEHFFKKDWEDLDVFVKDMSLYLGLPYDGDHFKKLHDLGYLPMRVKALPEGIETPANVPHMTFINTVDGFGWLVLYLETIVSSASWKMPTSATLALRYRRNVEEWVMKTDPENAALIPFMCHDFSSRGLSPWDMVVSGIGHASSFLGSDSLSIIPVLREFYGVGSEEMPIYSVNASEHSVSTTKIFTVGEEAMITDWLKIFQTGILSIVADTFDLWKLITVYLVNNKEAIMNRDGKLVIRPDSGNPVDIICGTQNVVTDFADHYLYEREAKKLSYSENEFKGVIELLWDIFGGTINEQGYKVLDPHIGAIYGDAINLERQVQIYERLEAKGFAATNIVLGVGSFTYQYNTRDSLGFAAKGCWFEVKEPAGRFDYEIYKDPSTGDGSKKSLRGLLKVNQDMTVTQSCTWEMEREGMLQTIFEDGKHYNEVTFNEIKKRIDELV